VSLDLMLTYIKENGLLVEKRKILQKRGAKCESKVNNGLIKTVYKICRYIYLKNVKNILIMLLKSSDNLSFRPVSFF